MKTCLLVGAGAEEGMPYNVPSGRDFIWRTCYTKNDDLYAALREFYTPRLAKAEKRGSLPKTYQDLFLYEP